MRRASRVVALVALVAGCRSLPEAQRDASAGLPLRVMSYNIRYGNDDLDGIAAAIRAAAPDIVALQEVDVHWAERSKFADQATALGARLGMAVRFAPIYSLPAAQPTQPRREFGVAVLSRYPIVRWRNDTLTRLSTQTPDAAPTPMPGLLDATPDAPELAPLLARFHDALAGRGAEALTYPADTPTKRIDYVLTSPHFVVRSARVPVTTASDHRPLVVELMLDGVGR